MIYTLEDAWKKYSYIFIFAFLISLFIGLTQTTFLSGMAIFLIPALPIFLVSTVRAAVRGDGRHITGKTFTISYVVIYTLRLTLVVVSHYQLR